MREGLRASTVSQRKGDRAGSRRSARRVSSRGSVGDCNAVKSILPDLNSEADPNELAAGGDGMVEKGPQCEGGDVGDGYECKGTLAENEVEAYPADEAVKLKGVDTEVKSEIEEDSVHACLPKMEECKQEFDGNLQNLGHDKDEGGQAKTVIDLNMECSECNNLHAGEEEMVADKDKAKAADGVLQPRLVSNHICESNVIACSESHIKPDMEKNIAICTADVGNSDLQSIPAAFSGSSENVTCSLDSPGCMIDGIDHKRNVLMEEKPHAVAKILRSRTVVISNELHVSTKRKRAAGCHVNEIEVLKNDESNPNLKSHNKKCKGICGGPKRKDKENSLVTSVLQNEEAFAEELKKDDNNESFDGKRKNDEECWESSIVKVEEEASVLSKDDNAAKVLNNDVSEEHLVGANKKCKVRRGRGRTRKQHKENLAGNNLLENGEAASEDNVKIKQEEINQSNDGTYKQQKVRCGRLKKRGRGRPRKIEKDKDGQKLNLEGLEGMDKAGSGMTKQDIHQFFEGSKNLRRRGRPKKLANGTKKQQQFRHQWFKKRGPGRPRKVKEENDAQQPLPLYQEGTDNAGVDMKQVSNQLVEDIQVEGKIKVSGISSPSPRARLKRKRKNTEKQPLKSQISLSSKCNRQAKSTGRKEKNLVREQIIDMLKRAGWSVEYRPRNGKEYADAVYVNPHGKTHWSVTLAYRMLKKDVETGKVENFCFTPIPEEKLSSLFRVQVKTRSDKNVSRNKVKLGAKSKGGKKRDYVVDSPLKRKPLSERSGKQNRRRCALLVRGSGQGLSSATEESIAVSGKHSILSWMIESGVVPPGEKVHCRRRTKVLLEGSITRDGIHCSCCYKLHSVAQFEAHAGIRLQPTYQNLYLGNGSSLLQCQLETWSKQEEPIRLGFHNVNVDDNDPNDDTCGICGDGGNLICCDGCPSTFHQACLNIQKFPSGEWHCIYCSCKYCGTAGGDVDQADEKHEKSPSMLTCRLCDAKYHRFCAEENDQCSSSTFCGKSCDQIYERFQRLVGVRAEVGDGYTCTLIKRAHVSTKGDALEPVEVENLSKLAVALSVMDECFLPITDHRSGINIMRHTLYSCGSNFKRLNFRGFFTAILEKEDEIISAASIRIHGKELAEMPFIGTRNAYRRQGMCRRLLAGIELALRYLSIEKLVIPAVSEVTETWTSVFGFEPLGELGSGMTHMNIIVFPGVDMLQKPLLGQHYAGETNLDQEEENMKPADSRSRNHVECNGLNETKVHDDSLSVNCDSSTKALQAAELSFDNGCHAHLNSAAIDQEGSKSGRIWYATIHSTDQANMSTLEQDDRQPDGVSDHVITPSEERILDGDSSLVEDHVCKKDNRDPSEALTDSGRAVFDDLDSRLGEDETDDSAPKESDGVADKMDTCDDHNPANDVAVQSNCFIAGPKLEVEQIHPSENGAKDPSSDTFSDGDLPSKVSGANDNDILVEELHASTCPFSSQTASKVVDPEIKFHDIKGQSSASGGDVLFIQDSSLPNGAQSTAKTPEQFESDLQVDCKIVKQFNLEKSCNMGSGSTDLATRVIFHA